jgi:hypothetical protein
LLLFCWQLSPIFKEQSDSHYKAKKGYRVSYYENAISDVYAIEQPEEDA